MMELLIRLSAALSPLFYKLCALSVTASVLGLLLLLLRRLMDKRLAPRWKCLLWALVLVALLFPWRPESRAALLDTQPIERLPVRQAAQWLEEPDPVQPQALPALPQPPQMEEEPALEQPSLSLWQLPPLVWLAGLLGLGGFTLVAAERFRRRQGRSASRPDSRSAQLFLEECQRWGVKGPLSLVMEEELSSPAIGGLWRPKLYLPSYCKEMEEQSLRYVLDHELFHYLRADLWKNRLLLVLQLVYWFNPLIWLLFRALREDLELANDAAVVEALGTSEAPAYSCTLVEVLARSQQQALGPALLCMCEEGQTMERRIKMIKLREVFAKHRGLMALGCVALAALLALLFLTRQPQGESPVPAENPEPPAYEEALYYFPPMAAPKAPASRVSLTLPAGWAQTGELDDSFQNLPPMESESGKADPKLFSNSYTLLYKNGQLVGQVGVYSFDTQQLDFGSEDYYKTVFPTMRMGSFYSWEPYERLERRARSEVGLCQISYRTPQELEALSNGVSLAAIPMVESWGIVYFDVDLGLRVTIGFLPDSVTREELEFVAQNLRLEQDDETPWVRSMEDVTKENLPMASERALANLRAYLAQLPPQEVRMQLADGQLLYSMLMDSYWGIVDPSQDGRELTAEEVQQALAAFEPIDQEARALNPLCSFVSSSYGVPQELDLDEFLRYLPGSQPLEDAAEFAALKALPAFNFGENATLDTMPVPIHCYDKAQVDELLRRCLNISSDVLRPSDETLYLPQYQRYYTTTSDAGFAVFTPQQGWLDGDWLLLRGQGLDGTMDMTLQKLADRWVIVAYVPQEGA